MTEDFRENICFPGSYCVRQSKYAIRLAKLPVVQKIDYFRDNSCENRRKLLFFVFLSCGKKLSPLIHYLNSVVGAESADQQPGYASFMWHQVQPVRLLYKIKCKQLFASYRKGPLHEIFYFRFFFTNSSSPKPLKITLGSFRNFSQIRSDIRK